ncbi:hypothetical protein OPS25_13930 [Alteromonas ponticola]|uniref:LysR family transcriptional regulator n=1 Tax=Alteromonas aquimaris TaxID=2998417 RepID=A0ABT3PA07_9ALTE|nr:hypothetical protein [Alteromonas aquimaris]MCW8109604.1 hypothetical protein [Alteromonas aquimaris]
MSVLTNYETLQSKFSRYLPKAIPVAINQEPSETVTSLAALISLLSEKLETENPVGWITCQSEQLLMDGTESLATALNDKYLLAAELTHQNNCINVYYEDNAWQVSLTSLANSNQSDAIALPHEFAIDALRFPKHTNHKVSYWVVWQQKNDQLRPVAQFLKGIEKTKGDTHAK